MIDRYVKRSRSRRPRPDPPSIEQPPTTSPTAVKRGFPQGSTFKGRATAPPDNKGSPSDPLADVPEPPGLEVDEAYFKAIEGVATKLENIRTELNQIQAMSRCLEDVLLHSDDDDAVQHADVAHVIARLLNDVVTDLELIKKELPTNKEMACSIMAGSETDVEV